ncbi:COG2863 Cytochrome c553 [Rhabdaerophilaceae bacterium]
MNSFKQRAAMLLAFCAGLIGWASVATSSAGAADKAFGEYLANECVACHLKSGRQVGGIPAIVGWPEDQFIAVMQAYRDGERDNQVMRTIAGKFKGDEIAALAAYFGSIKAPQ